MPRGKNETWKNWWQLLRGGFDIFSTLYFRPLSHEEELAWCFFEDGKSSLIWMKTEVLTLLDLPIPKTAGGVSHRLMGAKTVVSGSFSWPDTKSFDFWMKCPLLEFEVNILQRFASHWLTWNVPLPDIFSLLWRCIFTKEFAAYFIQCDRHVKRICERNWVWKFRCEMWEIELLPSFLLHSDICCTAILWVSTIWVYQMVAIFVSLTSPRSENRKRVILLGVRVTGWEIQRGVYFPLRRCQLQKRERKCHQDICVFFHETKTWRDVEMERRWICGFS